MDVVPAQVLYNDLAACHAAARRGGPIGDESVVAIPGHHWDRFTCGKHIDFVFSSLRVVKKKIIPRYRRHIAILTGSTEISAEQMRAEMFNRELMVPLIRQNRNYRDARI